jgi:hypothetical protein
MARGVDGGQVSCTGEIDMLEESAFEGGQARIQDRKTAVNL